MKRKVWLSMLVLAGLLVWAPAALGQARPYMGFVYPAGGKQGTTFQVKVGGQSLSLVTDVQVSGSGVTAKIVERFKRIGPQEMTLMGTQLRELRAEYKIPPKPAQPPPPGAPAAAPIPPGVPPEVLTMIARIEKRMEEYCNRPASNALAELLFIEVTIAPDAPPGAREIRLVMPKVVSNLGGVSNPMAFHVGQFPEFTRKPMLTANYQVLGKEDLALRKRPPEEEEVVVTPPCTMNGQIASGEVNKYRFTARKGQQLVISALARQLIPFMADAVPGWFQPVLTVYDSNGKEIVYKDDFRFKPDPVLLFEVPQDGEYIAAITDAIHRGREDFVYRITMGELPFVTSIFPLGGHAGEAPNIKVQGWNLAGASLLQPSKDSGPGIHSVAAKAKNVVSNAVPFALDTLPETLEQEPNDSGKAVQKVKLPIIVNGRITPPNDQDVFEFEGKAGESIAVEVAARRLDSPMDSVVKITGPDGAVLAVNDDYEDLAGGVNTHHADSYALLKLPADGVYRVHLGDTVRAGGDEYGYRLRISKAGPEFALRVMPSSVAIRSKSATSLAVYVARKDGFAGPIKVELKDPPPGITCVPVTIPADKKVARLTVKTDLDATPAPLKLTVVGSVEFEGKQIVREAVPTEDRMQAFLWRHLVPALDLQAIVWDPAWKPVPERVLPPPSMEVLASTREIAAKFTKNQVIGRLREIDQLYQERLLTDDFAGKRVAEATVNDDLPTDVLTKATAMAQAAVEAEKVKLMAEAKAAEDAAKAAAAAAVKAAEEAAKAKAAAVAAVAEEAKTRAAAVKVAGEAAKAKAVAVAKAAEEAAKAKAVAVAKAAEEKKAAGAAVAKAAEEAGKAKAAAVAKADEEAKAKAAAVKAAQDVPKAKAAAVAKAAEETKAKAAAAKAAEEAKVKAVAAAKAEGEAATRVAALAKAADEAKIRVAAAKTDEEAKAQAIVAKAAEDAKVKAVAAAKKAEEEAKAKVAAAKAVKDPKAQAAAAKAAEEANARAAVAAKAAGEATSTAAAAAKVLAEAQAKAAVAKAALDEMARIAAAAKAELEEKAKAAVAKAAEEAKAKAAAAAKAAEEAKAKAAAAKPPAEPAKAPAPVSKPPAKVTAAVSKPAAAPAASPGLK